MPTLCFPFLLFTFFYRRYYYIVSWGLISYWLGFLAHRKDIRTKRNDI